MTVETPSPPQPDKAHPTSLTPEEELRELRRRERAERALAPAPAKAPAGGIPTKSANDIEGEGLCLAISSAKGGGKTLMAGSLGDCRYVVERAANKEKPVLVMDVEGGMLTLRHRPDVEYTPITEFDQFERYVDYLISVPELPWGAVIVDNGTELAELNMARILRKARKDVPEWPEFRLNTSEMTTQVRKLRDLARKRGIVVVFNVWDFATTDDAGNIRKVGIDMTPRLGGRFAGAVDMIAWLEVLDDDPPCTRVLHLAGNNRVVAKFRKPVIGPGRDIPYDLYWRDPEKPENNPLVSLVNTLLGGEPWPKHLHQAPANVRAGLIRRAATKES